MKLDKIREILLKMYQGHKTNYEKLICWLPDKVLDQAESAIKSLINEELDGLKKRTGWVVYLKGKRSTVQPYNCGYNQAITDCQKKVEEL